MKLTRAIFLAMAFLIPTVSTVARAEDKPAAEGEGDKKAKKGKKGKKAEGAEGEKKEGAEKK